MVSFLSEAATGFAQPGEEGVSFSRLEDAAIRALSTPLSERHRSAYILTASGKKYGWEALQTLADHGYTKSAADRRKVAQGWAR